MAACLQPPPGAPGEALVLAQPPQVKLTGYVEVGLCWLILSPPAGGRVVWHNGGTWGFRSFAGFAPDQSSAASVLTNTTRRVDRLGLELTQDRKPGASPRRKRPVLLTALPHGLASGLRRVVQIQLTGLAGHRKRR